MADLKNFICYWLQFFGFLGTLFGWQVISILYLFCLDLTFSSFISGEVFYNDDDYVVPRVAVMFEVIFFALGFILYL